MSLNNKLQSGICRYKPKKFSLVTKYNITSLIFIACIFNSSAIASDHRVAKEYYLKAAFLYNFARLVEWPSNSFKNPNAPIQLCLIGENSFGQALRTIQGKKIKNRKLSIDTNITLNNISKCQILFLGNAASIIEILKITRNIPILTVSESKGFAHKSGHIRLFLTKDETLSLEVNHEAIKASDLKISSRILTLATIVKSDEANK